MQFPGRNQRGPDPYAGIARGEQIKPDGDRHGVVDDGNVAWPERVAEARRSWPQADPSDFERLGKRTYRDKATGLELVAVRGAPLLAIGQEQTRGATCSSWKPAGSSSCADRTSRNRCSGPPAPSAASR